MFTRAVYALGAFTSLNHSVHRLSSGVRKGSLWLQLHKVNSSENFQVSFESVSGKKQVSLV